MCTIAELSVYERLLGGIPVHIRFLVLVVMLYCLRLHSVESLFRYRQMRHKFIACFVQSG